MGLVDLREYLGKHSNSMIKIAEECQERFLDEIEGNLGLVGIT